ncbi:MAG: DUF3995 domain-containing protein [Pseudomonadota bacterium]
MIQISTTLALAQGLIALLHLAWALKIWWPIHEETALARAVVGVQGIEKMPPPGACAVVALALAFGAAWPFFPDGWFRTLGLLALSLVFLGRGLFGFTGTMARIAPEEPFRTLNRRYYNLICIALGLGHAMLFFGAIS